MSTIEETGTIDEYHALGDKIKDLALAFEVAEERGESPDRSELGVLVNRRLALGELLFPS